MRASRIAALLALVALLGLSLGPSLQSDLLAQGQPILEVSPTSLSFQGQLRGPQPEPQYLTIANAGGGVMEWHASADADWIILGAEGGKLSGGREIQLLVWVKIEGLEAGEYQGTVTIEAPGAGGSPVQVSVTLTLTSGLSQLPERIKIGGPISLSGKYAREGQQIFWGVMTAVQWINKVYGGVSIGGNKIPIEYIYYDDESKKENITSLLERLITLDGINFLLAPYSSGLTLAGAPIAEQYKILYMSVGGASDRIFEQGYRYIVQTIGPGSRYQISPLDMVRTLDPEAKRVALLFEDSEFARSILTGAEAHAAELGFEIVFERTYPKGVADLTSVLSEMAATEPEVLLGGGHFADGQLLALQMRHLGIKVKAASILVAPTLPDFYETLGDMANGFMAPVHWEIGVTFSPETTPTGMEWFGPTQDEFISTFRMISDGEDPDYHAACGGAAILAYVKAIELTQSLDADAVRAAMNELHFMSFYGRWGIDPGTGKQIDHEMVLIQWQSGQKEIVWPKEGQAVPPLYPMP